MSLTREQVIAKSAHGIICNSDVQDFRDTDAALREELGNQQWQHAACLTIAEGTTGWDIPTANDSLAMTTVRQLRQRVAELEQRQAWLDAVGPPNHPDDERYWAGAYLTAQQQLATVTQRVAELERDNLAYKNLFNENPSALYSQLATVTQEREFYKKQNLALLDRWNHGYTVTVEQERDALRVRLREVEEMLKDLTDAAGDCSTSSQSLKQGALESGASRPAHGTGGTMSDPKERVCNEIRDIMATYHEQETSPRGVGTPGGLEHMGDVWGLFLKWEDMLNAMPQQEEG